MHDVLERAVSFCHHVEEELCAVCRTMMPHSLLFGAVIVLLIRGAPFVQGEDEGGGGTTVESATTAPPLTAEVEEDEDYYEDDYEYVDEDTPPPAHPPIPDHLPRFVVSLPDTSLLCFSIVGFELFTYNLLSTPHLHANIFLNVTRTPQGDWVRGGTDLGFLVKIRDGRVKSGQRLFKVRVFGARKRADIAGFGEVDMQGGSVEFSIDREGHSNIESSEALNEQFTISMESPKVKVWAVSGDGVTYNVYIEERAGLLDMPTHGILGQFMRPGVSIDAQSRELHLGPDRDPIPVELAPVWDSVQDEGYQDKQCWYPTDQDNMNILEGQPYDYVTEHLLAHKYLYSEFDPKSLF